jgi:acyl-CoA synthetase (AMP-forming)/AMP-acid ligase II
MLSHGGLAANVASIVEYLSLTANDSVLTPMPFNYSYGSSVLHTHLAVGARVLIESNFVYPHKVVERMVTERITGFSGVPSTYALLLSRVDLAAHDLSALRYVTQAGGPMPVPLVARLTTALPRTRVFIMYGQTEATARLSYLPSERLQDKLGSIGKAIPGVTIEVRDESGQTVSNGVRGELWARGPNLMLGYWRDAEASARVLCQGWLKTGDMGYRDEDGFFWLVGRRSDIIKTGAHRVHPTEIEEVATACRGVQECAVVGVDDEMLGQVIKLYVVLQPNAQADAMSLKAHCRDRLAPHKVPRFVEIVAELPKTASGKVQRHRLTSA